MMTEKMNIEIWKDKNSLLLFAAQLMAQLSDKILSLGMIWVLTTLGGEKITPWFIFCGTIPYLLMMPFIPAVIEKYGALKTTYYSDFIRSLLFLLTSALLFFGQLENSLTFNLTWILLTLNFLSSTVSAFFNSAIYTLPVRIVTEKHLQELSALITGCFSAAQVLGPLLAASLYQIVSLKGLLLLNAGAFFVAGFIELFIKELKTSTDLVKAEEVPTRSPLELFKQDLTIRGMLLLFFSLNLFLYPLLLFFPLFAKAIFGGEVSAFMSLELSMGLGMVIGPLILTMYKSKRKLWVNILSSIIIISLFYFIFSLSKNLLLSSLATFCIGLTLQYSNILLINFFQTRVANSEVPSIMTLVQFITTFSAPLSMVAVGFLTKFYIVSDLATTFSLLLLLLAPILLLIPKIKLV